MAVHSEIGASSYHRWGACPGSVALSRNIPPSTSVYAEEGTFAHTVAAALLQNEALTVSVDEEMMDAVQVYTTLVQELSEQAAGNGFTLIEHKFNLEKIHPGLFGTADAVVYNKVTKTLQVVDFKYGQGIAVEVKGNEQLMYYGLGALLSQSAPCEKVELIIVQPRCPHPDGPIRQWLFDAVEILDFAADLKVAALATLNPRAPLIAGEHCRFCPAAGICPELAKNALTLAKTEFSPTFTYDPLKLATTLEWLPTLEGWIKNVREFAYQEALHGRNPPGWKLVNKRATRRWKDETLVLNDLANTFGLQRNQFIEESLKSPAQIEKLLNKTDKNKLEQFIVAESSGTALAHESDKRDALKLDAKSEFLPAEDDIFK